jgi:hypothetical protein
MAPRRSPWSAGVILGISLAALSSLRVVTSGSSVNATAQAAAQRPIGGQPASAVAAAVVNFEDLVRQDELNPRPIVIPAEEPAGDEREPWENPSLDPRRWPARSSAGSRPAIDHPAVSTGPSPAPLTTFGAIRHDVFTPPDTMGAVGLQHVLTVTNHELQAHTTGHFSGQCRRTPSGSR